jgi:prevent-host-death family protein
MSAVLATNLKRQATALLTQLEQAQGPILIEQPGHRSAYLVDVSSYEKLQKRVALLEGIARGERAVEDGRVVSHVKAKMRMRRWLK